MECLEKSDERIKFMNTLRKNDVDKYAYLVSYEEIEKNTFQRYRI